MPIIAVVWGNRARDALLALPYLLEPEESSAQRQGKSAWRRGRLGSFADVAREHFSEIQLVDSVQLDVHTGRTWFLLSDFNATKGMSAEAVSCPVGASELRRCAL